MKTQPELTLPPALFQGAGTVLCAFSGGVDSVVLLCRLLACADAFGYTVAALHVHHGIRPHTADRDAAFCRDFCAQRGVPFQLVYADAPALAKTAGCSLEEAGRQLRYRALADACRADPTVNRIATAHHADDQAETVLFRLARGTSPGGLCGIAESRLFMPDVLLIRPLLQYSKQQLRQYAAAHGLTHVEDETNRDMTYARNRIREQVLPALKTVNAGCVRNLCRLASRAEQDEAYFSAQTEAFLETQHGDALDARALAALHPALGRRVLVARYTALCGTPPQQNHIDKMLALMTRCGGEKHLPLPHGIVFSSDGTFVRLEHAADYRMRTAPLAPFCHTLKHGENRFPGAAYVITLRDAPPSGETRQKINKMSTRTIINSDKLIGNVYIRPRSGHTNEDAYLCGGCRHTVRDLLSTAHVPQDRRGAIPLFCDDAGIFWVPFCSMRDSVNPRLEKDGKYLLIEFDWEEPCAYDTAGN